MGRNALFWGLVLILVGGLLLLDNLGVINVNVWGLIWPLALIALGATVLWSALSRWQPAEPETVTIPLEGATQARVRAHHRAGRMRVDDRAGPAELLTGTFRGSLERRVGWQGETLDVDMTMPAGTWSQFGGPWNWTLADRLDSTFGLNPEVALALDVETGAGQARLDLSGLQVTDLRLKAGTGRLDVTLPANAGHTRGSLNVAAGSMRVEVPPGVAARIVMRGGVGSVNVNRDRFLRHGNGYRSPDYDTATNRADLEIEVGVGSLQVG